jgi:drug/metabolite transporter (DMT)-like permease
MAYRTMSSASTPASPAHSKELAYACLALTVLAWGIAPAFIRTLSLSAGPADALVIRMLANAIPCALLLPFFGGYRVARRDLLLLLMVSWFGTFGYFCGTIFGFARVATGIGGIIISTQPILIALLAALVGVERLRISTLVGLAISFAGSFYLFSADAVAAARGREDLLIGGLMIFAAGIFWSVYVIYCKRLIQTYGSFKITALSSILCAIPSLLFLSSTTLPTVQTLDHSALIALAYLTFIGVLLTVSTWNYAAAALNPNAVGSSLYLIPVLAILSGSLILGESITATTVVAGLIILAGVAIAQFGGFRR